MECPCQPALEDCCKIQLNCKCIRVLLRRLTRRDDANAARAEWPYLTSLPLLLGLLFKTPSNRVRDLKPSRLLSLNVRFLVCHSDQRQQISVQWATPKLWRGYHPSTPTNSSRFGYRLRLSLMLLLGPLVAPRSESLVNPQVRCTDTYSKTSSLAAGFILFACNAISHSQRGIAKTTIELTKTKSQKKAELPNRSEVAAREAERSNCSSKQRLRPIARGSGLTVAVGSHKVLTFAHPKAFHAAVVHIESHGKKGRDLKKFGFCSCIAIQSGIHDKGRALARLYGF
eukprot:6485790-Amphidinium_carterae.1